MTPFASDAPLERALDIVAVFAQRPEAGGGFHQSMNSLATLVEACGREHRVRAVILRGGLPRTERLVRMLPSLASVEWVAAPNPRGSRIRRVLKRLSRGSRLLLPVLHLLKGPSKESFLDALGADLIYFLSPSGTALQLRQTPFVMTVWDVCHLDFPEFPEVRADGEFERREALFSRALPQAVLVVADSETLSDRIHARYGVDRSRLLVQPFRPSPFLAEHAMSREEVLAHHGLEPSYWFYPAQFWAHKNHVRILEAMAILGRGIRRQAVFAGGDMGFRAYVEEHVRRLGLTQDVRFLGFVPAEHLRGLYEGAVGLVYSSYFGPTNLPPLEAIALGVPVICSDFHEQTIGTGPLYFDPDDASQLADRMHELLSAVERGAVDVGVRSDTPGAVADWERRATEALQRRIATLAPRLAPLRVPAGPR